MKYIPVKLRMTSRVPVPIIKMQSFNVYRIFSVAEPTFALSPTSSFYTKYYFAAWYQIKSDGGCFAGWSLLRCSRKAKGVGGYY